MRACLLLFSLVMLNFSTHAFVYFNSDEFTLHNITVEVDHVEASAFSEQGKLLLEDNRVLKIRKDSCQCTKIYADAKVKNNYNCRCTYNVVDGKIDSLPILGLLGYVEDVSLRPFHWQEKAIDEKDIEFYFSTNPNFPQNKPIPQDKSYLYWEKEGDDIVFKTNRPSKVPFYSQYHRLRDCKQFVDGDSMRRLECQWFRKGVKTSIYRHFYIQNYRSIDEGEQDCEGEVYQSLYGVLTVNGDDYAAFRGCTEMNGSLSEGIGLRRIDDAHNYNNGLFVRTGTFADARKRLARLKQEELQEKKDGEAGSMKESAGSTTKNGDRSWWLKIKTYFVNFF